MQPFGKGVTLVKAVIASMVYALPTRAWLQKVFAPALRADQERLGIRKYVLARNDCSDFSIHAMSLARVCHALSGSGEVAFAFGTVDYFRDIPGEFLPGGHRINLTFVKEGDIYRPVFFEPQIPGIVFPNPDELDSINAYYV
jgi:hypothetical protein